MGCGASRVAVAVEPSARTPGSDKSLPGSTVSSGRSLVKKIVTVQQVDASGKVVKEETRVVYEEEDDAPVGSASLSQPLAPAAEAPAPLPGAVDVPAAAKSSAPLPKRHAQLAPLSAATTAALLDPLDRASPGRLNLNTLAPIKTAKSPASRLPALTAGAKPGAVTAAPTAPPVPEPPGTPPEPAPSPFKPAGAGSSSSLTPLSSAHSESPRSKQPTSPLPPSILKKPSKQLSGEAPSTGSARAPSPFGGSASNTLSPAGSLASSALPSSCASSGAHASVLKQKAQSPLDPQQSTSPRSSLRQLPSPADTTALSPLRATAGLTLAQPDSATAASTSTSSNNHVRFITESPKRPPSPRPHSQPVLSPTPPSPPSPNRPASQPAKSLTGPMQPGFGLSPSFGYLVSDMDDAHNLTDDMEVGGVIEETDEAASQQQQGQGANSRPVSQQLSERLSTRSDISAESGVSGGGLSQQTSIESVGSLINNLATGPSVFNMKNAGMTGADLVTRALQKGINSMRRISTDGGGICHAEPHIKKRHVASCAVSLAFLLEFSSRIDAEMSTLDVVYKIIVPETARHRCRYVDFVPDDHLNQPDYFVSHRWAAPFKNLVSSLFLHFDCANGLAKGTLDPANIFLWLDIFAVNQHPGEAQAGDLAGLQAALGASRSGTLLCLDEQGLVLTRIWCLYEIHHTIRLKGVPGLRVLAADVQFTELRDIFNSLNAKHAQATVEEDRRRILADIEATTGIVALNQSIKEALVESCLLEARATEPRLKSEPAAYVAAHYKAGQMLRVAGKYKESEQALNKTIQVYERGMGVEDKLYAVCLISMGSLMQEEGKLQEAERLCREGLQLSQQLLDRTVARYQRGGEEMPAQDMTYADLMAANNALAGVLQAQGKFSAALPFCEKAVATSRMVHGDDHPDTGTAMQSLALLYQAMGRSNEALRLMKKVLALREKTLGVEHPLTAITMDALGLVYQQRGSFAEAEPLFLKALAVRRRFLGEMHPAVASSLHNLGGLMADGARVEEAETFYVTALQIREQVLGPGHPAYAATLNNLAALYKEAGRVEEAVPLLQHALEARTRSLGPEHPATSSSMSNLATLLLERGHVDEAEPLYRKHIMTLEKVLGPQHPDVALGLQNYATCLRAAGNLTQAAMNYKRALAILESKYDSLHPDVAHCVTGLAALLQEQGQLVEASNLYERALNMKRKVHGEQHSSLVPLLHALGVLAAKQGLLELAEKRLLAAVSMRRTLNTCLSTQTSRPVSALGNRPKSSSQYIDDLTNEDETQEMDVNVVAAGLLSRNASVAMFNSTAKSSQRVHIAEGEAQLASSLTELGNVQQDLGKLNEAEASYQDALEIREAALGDDHTGTAATREALGTCLLELGRCEEAEALLRSALETNLARAGKDVAALSSYNLGRCLEKLGAGRWEAARDAYTQAVQLAGASLGPEHPDTQQYKENLTSFLRAATQGGGGGGGGKPKSAKKGRRKSRAAKSVATVSDDENEDAEIEF